MNYLVDTQMLLWTKREPGRISARARAIISDEANAILFSVVSIWEVVIKNALRRPGFDVEGAQLRRGLLDSDYNELTVGAAHVLAVGDLPPYHRDPFDRLLVAQAKADGLRLLTADAGLERYGAWVQVV